MQSALLVASIVLNFFLLWERPSPPTTAAVHEQPTTAARAIRHRRRRRLQEEPSPSASLIPVPSWSTECDPFQHSTNDWRGINPGAETRAPVVTACLSLRGREFTIKCDISPMPGSDVLVGMDVLRGLFSDGFVLAR